VSRAEIVEIAKGLQLTLEQLRRLVALEGNLREENSVGELRLRLAISVSLVFGLASFAVMLSVMILRRIRRILIVEKRAQEEIVRLNAELERRVAARTAELRREKDKAESYLDIANTMFLARDREGNITLVNRKLCEVVGYAEDELLGQNWHLMCVPDDEVEERDRRYLDRIAGGSEAFATDHNAEFHIVTKGGELRTVSWSDSPIRDDDGTLVGVLGAAEDVTDQRRTEIELRQAQRSEAIANLAGGISHSLNNLLTPIVALGDMLQERLPADSGDQAFAAQIVESGRHASDLVQRILAFSRRDEPRPIVSNIAALVEDTVELLRQTIPTTITIDLDIDAAVGEVFADPVQIETVLMNLITNAAAAIGDKTGNIGVTLDRRHLEAESGELQAGDYARLTVADDGPGIPSDVLENIFNPFFTTKDVGEGTGLGLSIADGVIKRHGGVLRVQSEPGAGARFEVYLPLHDALEAA
jgi:PAS domain S-box-containing protein